LSGAESSRSELSAQSKDSFSPIELTTLLASTLTTS
jgi:hypothetical protein